MKSTLNKPQTCVEHTFPALYEDPLSHLVVLAKMPGAGTVVVADCGWSVGDYSDDWGDWGDFEDAASWQRLPSGSSVTLTQE